MIYGDQFRHGDMCPCDECESERNPPEDNRRPRDPYEWWFPEYGDTDDDADDGDYC